MIGFGRIWRGIELNATKYESVAPLAGGIIPLCVPEIRGNEWAYIKECLDTNYVSSVGLFVERFERMVADYVGTKFAVATVNGTAALHTALLIAGVQPDDEVLVSTLTFIAPANATRYCGAWPIFIDAEPQYWQIDPELLRGFFEHGCHWRNGHLQNKVTGRRVKAILPVHILGHPCDMDPIVELAGKYGIPVIEDATESLGARYKGQMVGNLGDMACFSFNGNKIITTGGGGMIVTNNRDWAEKARYLTTQAKDDPIEYIHNSMGYNYRLTNIQAAMGCAQMEQLDRHIAAKRSIANTYTKFLRNTPGITAMMEASEVFSTFWMYTVLIDETAYGIDSRSLLQYLGKAGIESRPLWQPMHLGRVHTQPPIARYPVAEHLYRQALSLPCSVRMNQIEQGRVLEMLQGSARP